MGFKNIEKKSLGYNLLYSVVRFWHNIVFYKKLIVVNRENIPPQANLIFTPNHQNALMDATALLFTIPRRLVFMARADIFAKAWVASILYFLKILPIYRSRDGKDSVLKNEAIFKRTVDVLTAGNGLVLLPEGSHEGVHYLRPLKKGFARIAFQTEESNDFSLNLKIVPIGIDYSNYQDFRTTLLVNFGSPILVSDYYDRYKDNPALAINALRDDLAERMKKLIIHIESKAYYKLYVLLKDIYKHKMLQKMGLAKGNYLNAFNADREFIRLLGLFEKDNPDEMSRLDDLVRSYNNKRKHYGITNEMMAKGQTPVFSLLLNTLILLLTFPLFVYGWLNNLFPYFIAVWAGGKIKDPQFKSSFKFVVSLLSFPLFYFLQTLAVAMFTTGWLPWAYLLSLPVSAAVAWWWKSDFARLRKQWRFFSLFKKHNPGFVQMMDEYRMIIEKANKIVLG
jgi:1-acyl-sn-glycerol-3-phosphate acyltransferase